MAGKGWNSWKWLDMTGNGQSWLKMAELGLKSLEIAKIAGNGLIRLEMSERD